MEEVGGGSGSGALPLTTAPPPTVNPVVPPRLVVLETNRNIWFDNTNNTHLFINVTYDPGNPRGLLQWRRNGVRLSSRMDPRVTILSQGGLSIRSVRPSDRGLYTVSASNSIGTSSESFSIFIRCKAFS